MISFKDYMEEWQRASLRKTGSVKLGHWNGKKFISDLSNQNVPGFDHERCKSINAQVEVNGKVVAGGIEKRIEEEVMTEASKWGRHDYEWDQEKMGYHVTTDGKRTEHFYPAKSQFNRSEADSAAKKHAQSLHVAEVNADRNAREHSYQMDKPLSEVEKRWVDLDRKLVAHVNSKGANAMTDDELNKYTSYGQAVRKSLLNHTHPAMAHRKR
jgi:ribosomal protein L20